jgi:RNA polymerase sigma factor (sigma-70 family)
VPIEIERLYREHRVGLVRLVERELHDHQDAEDVVQTAFLDAQRALERGTVPRNPGAWLAAIALHAAYRLRRRRLNAEPLEEYAVQEASRVPEICAALATLPRAQRVAVLYRDVLGLSYGETAERMGTSVNAVTMLLHRGRERLRQTLGVTVGGLGLWRWSKQAGMPQAAVAKCATAIAVTAGLATAGVVAAHAVAPIGADRTAAPAARSGGLTAAAGRTSRRKLVLDAARRPLKTVGGSRMIAAPASSTQGSSGDGTPESIVSTPAAVDAAPATTTGPAAAEVVPPLLPSTLRLPTVSLPTPPIPTSPPTPTVAATVTVSTPIISATVTTTGLTATTPIATVTVPIATVTAPIP